MLSCVELHKLCWDVRVESSCSDTFVVILTLPQRCKWKSKQSVRTQCNVKSWAKDLLLSNFVLFTENALFWWFYSRKLFLPIQYIEGKVYCCLKEGKWTPSWQIFSFRWKDQKYMFSIVFEGAWWAKNNGSKTKAVSLSKVIVLLWPFKLTHTLPFLKIFVWTNKHK